MKPFRKTVDGRKRESREREGMAILTVLLLVAIMSVVAVTVLDDVRFSVRRATNAETQGQAQWLASGAEILARRQIQRLVDTSPVRTPLAPDWNGRSVDFPVENGTIRATLADGQACFNLNSVVEGQGEDLIARPAGAQQFVALGRALGVGEGRMRGVAAALTDWLDADSEAQAMGAEDGAYAGRAEPYRTAGVMLADVSELRAVQGMDDALYRTLRPHLCALPTTRLSPINVNTLEPRHAPLLVMLSDGRIGPAQARAAIERRPPAGWATIEAFWAQPTLAAANPTQDAREQVNILTRFFQVRIDVDYADSRAVRTALLYARPEGGVQTVIDRWTLPE